MNYLVLLPFLLIVIPIVSILGGNLQFIKKAQREILSLLENAKSPAEEPITEVEITDLPPSVQKYLRFCGIVGQKRPQTVKIEQRGRIRPQANRNWMAFSAIQYLAADPASFVWVGNLRGIRAREKFLEGKGRNTLRFAGVRNIEDVGGEGIDQAALLRYLCELAWMPGAYLSENVQWKHINGTSARITLKAYAQEVSGVMTFNEVGEAIEFRAARYRLDKGNSGMTSWLVKMSDYQEFQGVKVPSRFQVQWELEHSKFKYLEFAISNLEYGFGAL